MIRDRDKWSASNLKRIPFEMFAWVQQRRQKARWTLHHLIVNNWETTISINGFIYVSGVDSAYTTTTSEKLNLSYTGILYVHEAKIFCKNAIKSAKKATWSLPRKLNQQQSIRLFQPGSHKGRWRETGSKFNACGSEWREQIIFTLEIYKTWGKFHENKILYTAMVKFVYPP